MSDSPHELGSTESSYAILAKLATGGMAEIYLARTTSGAGVERHVVLKRILRERARDSSFVRMFLDEAKLAALLQHPNVAQVYDTGVLGDSYFFTMEYVHGETVRHVLERSRELGRRIPVAAALTIAAGAAAGLHHAHERRALDGTPLGIVHRDISPSNLMVSFEGNVKVVDFGIAKASRRTSETQSGTIKGKIGYLSPEQCRGRAIDRRSDLFSLGIVLWELLVGEPLFRRSSDYESMAAIVQEDAPPPSSRRPDISPDVDAIVGKLLARSPADRYQTGEELLEALDALSARAGLPLSAASLGRVVRDLFGERPEPWIHIPANASTETVTVTAAALPEPTKIDIADPLAGIPDLSIVTGVPARSRRGLWLAAAAVTLVGATAIAVAMNRRSSESTLAAAPASEAVAAASQPAPAAPPAPPAASPPAPPQSPAPAPAPPPSQAPAPARTAAQRPRAQTPPPSRPADIAAAFRSGDFAAVVSACTALRRPTESDASACVVSACRVHDAARAERWLAHATASKRDALRATCRAHGTPLVAPAAGSASCDDPMACR